MSNLKINHLAVLVSVIIMHGLGFLWYDKLFGEQWLSMSGIDMSTLQSNPAPGSVWILNFVAIAAPIYVLAWLFTKLNTTSGVQGAAIAFLITFCFHHLAVMNGNMFARMPYGLAWITGGYSLVGLTIAGFILGAWTKKTA